jgi:hypothetical protein
MGNLSYLQPTGDMCCGQRLEDAEMQRLVEEAWRARVDLHRSEIEEVHRDIKKVVPRRGGRPAAASPRWNYARFQLGMEFLSRFDGNPLAGLHGCARRWFAREVGLSLCKAVFDEGFKRIEGCEPLWNTRDWERLHICGFIDADDCKSLQEGWPIGPEHDERRKQEFLASMEARFQANQG